MKLFFLLLFCTVCAYAKQPEQQNSMGRQAMESVVVTGTKIEQPASKSSVAVSTVGIEELSTLHALELQEGLAKLPNIMIKDIHGKEGSQVWMQGISGNRVLVVVDGEPISASTGSTVDVTQVSVSDIERIEVVKGAVSVLYGSQAMGGVINVITAKPDPGFSAKLSYDAGSYGKQNPNGKNASVSRSRVNTKLQYANEYIYLQGDINARYSDGFQADFEDWPQQGADGHKINASVLAGWMPTENAEFSIRHEQYDQEQHTRYMQSIGNNKFSYLHKQDDAKRTRTSIKTNLLGESWLFDAFAFTEKYTNDSKPSNFTRKAEMPSQKAGLQFNYDIDDNHVITIGGNHFEESLTQLKITPAQINDEIDGKKTRDSFAGFLQSDWQLGWFKITPGFRWQKDSNFGTHLSFALNTKFDLNEGAFLRLGYGQGYRVPNLKERWFVFDHSHLGYKVIGNPKLQPEESDSYQASLQWQALKPLKVNFGIFYNDLTQMISAEFAYNEPSGVAVSQYQNVEEAVTKGIEFSILWEPVDDFTLQSAYTFLRAIDKKTDQDLPRRPKHQVKTSLEYSITSDINVQLLSTYQSDEFVADNKPRSPSWSKWDLKANYDAFNHLSFYMGIDNITNEQRDFTLADYDRRPVEGRLVYCGFKANY